MYQHKHSGIRVNDSNHQKETGGVRNICAEAIFFKEIVLRAFLQFPLFYCSLVYFAISAITLLVKTII